MKTFTISAQTIADFKREYQGRGLPEDFIEYHVQAGIWYHLVRIEENTAHFEECPIHEVPAHVQEAAQRFYPGALQKHP